MPRSATRIVGLILIPCLSTSPVGVGPARRPANTVPFVHATQDSALRFSAQAVSAPGAGARYLRYIDPTAGLAVLQDILSGRWGHPSRRAFLAAFGALGVGQRLAAQQADQAGQAMRLIEADLKNLTPTQATARAGNVRSGANLVSHQLLAFGAQDARLNFLFQFLQFAPGTGIPFFPYGFEGHPASFVSEILVSGVNPEKAFDVKGRKVTGKALLQGVHDRYDAPGLRTEDPSWVILALTLRYSLSESWRGPSGQMTSVMELIGSAAHRFLAAAPQIEAAGFTEQGAHFTDALSHAIKRYRGTSDPDEQIPVYRLLIQRIVDQRARKVLPLYDEGLPKVMQDFAANPSKATAILLYSYFNQLGHLLEIALNPEGMLSELLPRGQLTSYIRALATGVQRWYGPEYAAARGNLRRFSLPDGIPIGGLQDLNLLHAYRALGFWNGAVRRLAVAA